MTLARVLLAVSLLMTGCAGYELPADELHQKMHPNWGRKAAKKIKRYKPKSYGIWLSSLPARGM